MRGSRPFSPWNGAVVAATVAACSMPFDGRIVSAAAFTREVGCPDAQIEAAEPLDADNRGFQVTGCGTTRYYDCNQRCCYDAKSASDATASVHGFQVPAECRPHGIR